MFVAYPNHQQKGLTGELIKLLKMRKELRYTMTQMDATQGLARASDTWQGLSEVDLKRTMKTQQRLYWSITSIHISTAALGAGEDWRLKPTGGQPRRSTIAAR
jgi:hypothetical protein